MNKLGFGFLRLPMMQAENGEQIDYGLLNAMVDAFLEGGGGYFDTAYTYLGGMSEVALRESLVRRYPRDRFQIADKLPGYKVKAANDCERFFTEQCERCGVDWFDVYMLHWLNPANYAIAEKFDEFGFLRKLKADGRAKKTGFSYHGDAALLDRILTAHPEVDIVQLQINYLDWNDPAIDARRCYETAVRHRKDVVVMEPVKGGTLANLPDKARMLLCGSAPENSPASWALRFAESLDAVGIVLSGMNTMEQMQENLAERQPLSENEYALLDEVCGILNQSIAIGCTACRYCESHCPKNIAIPDYFSIYNSYCRHPSDSWKMTPVYAEIASKRGKASDCIACRRCENNCPQGISITNWLSEIAKVME